MKRIIKILPAFCVMFVALLFAGCSIEAPTVTIKGCLVSWNWVSNATSYEVEVNGTTYTTTSNSYNIAPIIQKELATLDVRIKAKTKNIFLRDSSFSEIVTVTVGDNRLPTPQNFKVDITTKSYLCSWNKVENADSYCIRLFNDDEGVERFFFTESTSYNLFNKVDIAGKFKAQVFAYSNSNANTYAPSQYSEESQEFVVDVSLKSPDGLNFRQYDGNLYCEWKTIEGAESYNISVLNGETYNVENNASSEIQTLNLTQKGVTVGKGEAVFVCVGSVGAENSGYTDSPYTDMYAYYGSGTKNDFATPKYDFVGQEFDLVANSYAELQNILWFSLYYRVTNMKFFFDYDNNYNDAINSYKKCLIDYQEIKHISYSIASMSDGSYLSSIDFIHPMYPTKTADATSSQNQNMTPNSYASTPRASDFDDFGVEKRTKTAKVYNSDQLYYAVQNGCKPIFPDESNPALVVYNEAKNILRDIISDDMTDYEKVRAIFDWMCFNTHYDHDLPKIDSKINSGEMSGNSSDYRGFYIEGVFFDQGQSVCDGMSKAFALLCGMEDIDCYKVVGISNSSNNTSDTPDHAWNKVKIDLVGDDGIGEWYVVDVTQNDYYESDYVEVLSHYFFLHTDEWTTNVSKHKELSPKTDVANTEFDYYANTTYDGSNDILIQSRSELEALASYTKSNLRCIEFAIDTSVYYSYSSLILREKFGKGLLTSVVFKSLSLNKYISGKNYEVIMLYYT